MCGIAGIINFNREPVSVRDLERMSNIIHHRGPDDEGYVFINPETAAFRVASGKSSPPDIRKRYRDIQQMEDGAPYSIGLAHRRFSIVDLSSGGHQPFFGADRSCCVVFNGEIYNYAEIRQSLEAEGVMFSTSSDTEVLVEAYRHWGSRCFSLFNGFWAVAIYDFNSKSLVLSTDRIGKKQIYWSRKGDTLYFASEIKALLAVRTVGKTREVNELAAANWIAHGLRDLDDSTFFKDIFRVPAASAGVVTKDFPRTLTYFWQVPTTRKTENQIREDDASAQLRELLSDAVSIRLRADVPWAVELSGGLDSSALLAMAAHNRPGKITSYTVQFDNPEDNEEPWASSVARNYDVDYRVLRNPDDNFWAGIRSFTMLHEEPYHSPNLKTNQTIWAQMRGEGTKISINGAGGDELFGGYHKYFAAIQIEHSADGNMRRLLDNAINWTENSGQSLSLKVRSLVKSFGTLSRYYYKWKARERCRYLTLDTPPHDNIGRRLSEMLLSDMTRATIPYWMSSGDKNTMSLPLEFRAPFLDYRLVEFAFQLPAAYLIRHGWHKWILRKALSADLPQDVLWRKRKLGFPFPLANFLNANAEIIEFIHRNSSAQFLDKAHLSRYQNNWRVISYILWYELFINENSAFFDKIEAIAQRSAKAEGMSASTYTNLV